jgi:hypothetical protein
MRSFLHALGGYPLPGVIVVVLAGAGLLFWEYQRLSGSAHPASYMPRLRVIAVSLTVLSVVLITSRFVYMEHLY